MQWNIGFYDLLSALYTRLTTDSVTSAYRIYDEVPETVAFPFVHISGPYGVRSTNFSAQDRFSENHIVTIDIFSDYAGNKECAEMMSAVSQAVSGTPLTVTGYNVPLVLIDLFDILIDASAPTHVVRHGIIRYRFHLEPTT
jgi:hypothetical protein